MGLIIKLFESNVQTFKIFWPSFLMKNEALEIDSAGRVDI